MIERNPDTNRDHALPTDDSDPKTAATPTGPSANPSASSDPAAAGPDADVPTDQVEEIGGPDGPDPTRFGDWERKGRCIDF